MCRQRCFAMKLNFLRITKAKAKAKAKHSSQFELHNCHFELITRTQYLFVSLNLVANPLLALLRIRLERVERKNREKKLQILRPSTVHSTCTAAKLSLNLIFVPWI